VHLLGVVPYLNSRPLIDGLLDDPRLDLRFDVPSRLAEPLLAGKFDVALVPIIDVIRSAGRLSVICDACIACDGETMTVRVFSQIPPHRIETLRVDGDSHTSVALVRILWQELFDRRIELVGFDARHDGLEDCPAVLLIGDKVVAGGKRRGFAYEVDLGGAWRQHTGLPFVFAVWAAPSAALRADPARFAEVAGLLSAARDRGVLRAREIAEQEGPRRWWPVELASRYLTRCLTFRLDARYVEGANLFAQLAARHRIVSGPAEIAWPAALCAPAAS